MRLMPHFLLNINYSSTPTNNMPWPDYTAMNRELTTRGRKHLLARNFARSHRKVAG